MSSESAEYPLDKGDPPLAKRIDDVKTRIRERAMSELRVTDEMVAACEAAEASAPKDAHDDVVTRLGLEAALRAGGFTEEVTFGQTLDPRAQPRAKRLVGPWVPISEVVSDGE